MCKAVGCESNEEVAFGLCWNHACKAADILGETPPAVQMRASGILPVKTDEELDAVVAFDEAMMAEIGHVMRARLGVK